MAGYRYKCVIWDWNGTLLDDMDVCVSVMNNILKCRDLPWMDMERYRSIFGFPVKNYYRELGFDFQNESFEDVSNEFVFNYQKQSLSSCLRKDAVAVMDHIRDMGISQVILSASQINNLEEQVRYFGIYGYFDKLLGLDHCHATSKLDIGRSWLAESGLSGDEVILVGDTLHDLETANELGCNCLLLSSGHQSRERLKDSGAHIIDSLAEVRDYLIGSSLRWENIID